MIYVQEKDFPRQIELLGFISSIQPLSICAWQYPESKEKTILNISLQRSELEPVTTYENGFVPFHTEPAQCTTEFLKTVKSSKQSIASNCDSSALYSSGSNSWFAATIGHEGMCLVKDHALLNKLLSAGFAASLEAPSWW